MDTTLFHAWRPQTLLKMKLRTPLFFAQGGVWIEDEEIWENKYCFVWLLIIVTKAFDELLTSYGLLHDCIYMICASISSLF